MSKVKRYYIGRNRDHEKVMTEITDNDKRFIKIPDDEWVRASFPRDLHPVEDA